MHTNFENFMAVEISNAGEWEGEDAFGYSFAYAEFNREAQQDFYALYGYDEAPVIGWYFVTWSSQGVRTLTLMPNEDKAEDAYTASLNDYYAWLGEE